MKLALRALCVGVVLVAGCARPIPEMMSATPEPLDPLRDYHSYANTADFVTRHLVLDLAVDFRRGVLEGSVELQLERRSAGARELVLDTRDLDIAKVESAGDQGWEAAAFSLDARDAILGSALRIALPSGAERVRIHYATRPQASALQWLTPAQTAGKKHPFLYTQSQAIHARSWIPLQDTPQVRATYEARIRAPKELVAVMSANHQPKSKEGAYRFHMPQPVPSYLIALAVGDLRFRAIGPRTGIYAEPPLLRAAAREFEDAESLMRACEKLYGPYRWDRYDLLVLPPSFPYGGMENPRLTFLTPTSIAGDKSGVALIAHELAHSWSGNLVTNASWRDFWLNEGTTTYLTYRLMDEVYGQARGDMERVLGYQELQRSLAQAERPGDRALAVDQRGRDPDEVFSSIPYGRGALFFANLEAAFGRARFDAFLRGWFDDNAFQSRNTEQFVRYLEAHLLTQQPGVFAPEKVRQWVYSPEIPADAVLPRSDAFAKVDEQRSAWLEGRIPLRRLDTRRWSVLEWRHFLDNLPESVRPEQLAALDARFDLSRSKNAFIARDWLRQAIVHRYEPAYPELERFLTRVGRTLLIRRLYQELVKTESGRAFALRVYEQARPAYHSITRAAIERVFAEADKLRQASESASH